MPVTVQDLAEFNRFAEQKLAVGSADWPDLLRDWLETLNAADADAAIREGIADVDAGRTRPAREFMTEVREKLDPSK
jgi:hypothetical protein